MLFLLLYLNAFGMLLCFTPMVVKVYAYTQMADTFNVLHCQINIFESVARV